MDEGGAQDGQSGVAGGSGGLFVPATPTFVQALYAYASDEASSLSFERGDVIEVLSTLASGWWDGVLIDKKIRGWFPSNYVQKISEQEAIDALRRPNDSMTATMTGEGFTGGIVPNLGGARSSLTADQTLEQLMNGNDLASFFTANGQDVFSEIAAASTSNDTTRSDTHIYADYSREPAAATDANRTSSSSLLEDLWLPRMTKNGQLFYYNSRTKETSRDLPIDGVGDGIVIPRDEFASDDDDDDQGEATDEDKTPAKGSKWRAQYTSDGAAMYYVDQETGEQRWTRPQDADEVDHSSQLDVPQSLYSRQSVGDASLMSAWTEKTALASSPQETSAAPSEAGTTTDDNASTADSAVEGTTLQRTVPVPSAQADLTSSTISKEVKRRSRQQARKALAKELIEVMPPPLLEDLEVLVTRALQGLINVAIAPLDKSRLVGAIEAAVAAMRATLHATSALDYPISQASSSSALPYFIPNVLANNVIDSSFASTSTMSYEVLVQLRPYHRRLVSTFSKVIFSARALWGTLETMEDDQPVTAEDILIYTDEEIMTMRNNWIVSKTARVEHAEKLRVEVASGAEEVRSHFAAFVAQFEALSADGSVALNVPRPLLRAPKSLQGSLRTNAAALLLPGGGYGGNWRGNGFVTLPDSTTAPDESCLLSTGALSYSYPSKKLDQSYVTQIEADAGALSSEIQSFKAESELSKQISSLQNRLGALLRSLEEVDLSASIDTEIRSRADDQSFTTPAEFEEGQEKETETELVKFQASVAEARSLLGMFRTRKQALYDLGAVLMLSIQSELSRAPASETRSDRAKHGPQPFDALAEALASTGGDTMPQPISTTLSMISAVLVDLLLAVVGLLKVAGKQDSAPKDIRRSLVIRHSFKPSPSASSLSRFGGTTEASSIAPSSKDHSARHSGVYGADGASASASRQSVDSDFFFSNESAVGQASKTTVSSMKDKAPSIMTMSSVASETHSGRQDSFESTDSPSRSPSKRSKLTQLLGPDAAQQSRRNVAQPQPWYLGSDYGADDISFNMEGQVKGGTLRGLVIAATSHEGRVDSNYLSTFLLTYRTFCTSQQLLDQLIDRYSIQPPPDLGAEDLKNWETRKLRPIKARVANMIKAWVREYIDNDEKNLVVLRQIAQFASQDMKDPVQSPQIIKAVDERIAGNAPRPLGSLAPGALPASIVPRTFRKLRLTDIDPLEAARQLTIMEGRFFSRITPEECLAKAWPKQYASDTPNISAMIEMSNAVTRWVTETILAIEDVKKRASMIKVFVQLGERCLSLNNFSTLIHIIAGLNSTPIHRLRRTWEAVSQKTMYSLGALNKIMKPDKNYKEYREMLRRVTPPCVPFLGVYLTDWTFIGDGNPDFLREKPHQINFNKRQKAAELILSIRLHQSTTYNLAAVPALVKFFEEQLFDPARAAEWTDQKLYELSLQREPRERDDEKIARLLSESGFL